MSRSQRHAPHQRVGSTGQTTSKLATIAAVGALVVSIGVYCYRRYWRTTDDTDGHGGTGERRNNGQDANLHGSGSNSRGKRAVKRAMSISLRNTVVWNPSPDPTAPNFAFLHRASGLLRHFARAYDLYLIMQVTTDEEKTEVTRLLRDAGLIRPEDDTVVNTSDETSVRESTRMPSDNTDIIDSHRLLFCQTVEGVAHIVRHIMPAVHIDTEMECIRMVRTFVGRVIWVRRPAPAHSASATTGKGEATVKTPEEEAIWAPRGASVEVASSLAECTLSPFSGS